MPHQGLIAARPWSDTDAREGLLRWAAGAEAGVGGRRVRVICEPLLTHDDAGQKLRAVRLEVSDAGGCFGAGERSGAGAPSRTDEDPPAEVIEASGVRLAVDGHEVPTRTVAGPCGSLRLLVPAADRPQRLEVRLPALDPSVVVCAELDVVRPWTVHVVHHSHLDIGYTDPQPQVLHQQRSYLDSALDLIRATADWPEESRFRWVVESLWTFEQWARHRPACDVAEFVEQVKAGRIELTAMPYNLHTDTCSTDELHQLLQLARQTQQRYGVDIVTAMQTDVPGTVAGLPDALAAVGVRYLSVAHNWAGRSMPHTSGGKDLPRLFRWRSPAGNSVLVWMTDSPHGLAYMEGPFLGFHDGFETVDRLLPAYLTSLGRNSYPYPPGVFGWHGEPISDRRPYPWDIVHLRTQGWVGDNAPARLAAPEVVRRWNETWDSPRLTMSTNEEFFVEAERRIGEELQTFEGDWGDWWVEGIGSAALPQSLVRRAQVGVTDGPTVSRLAHLVGGSGVPEEVEQTAAAYRAISLFNEHTWGASNSWRFADEGADAGELQWHWKASHAMSALDRSGRLVEEAGAYLGAALAPAPDALTSVLVVNTAGFVRTTTVRFLLRESVVGRDIEVVLRDARSGAELAVTEQPQANPTHREAGRWLTARVPDVPPLGLVRLDVSAAPASAPPAVVAGSDHRRPGSGLPGLEVGHDLVEPELPDLPRSELLTLENRYLRVRFDDRRCAIASILDKSTGRELVNPDAVVGFNGYVYDTYGSAPGYNHLANKLEVGEKLELLGSRSLARPAALVRRGDDGVEQTLVYEFAADGIDRAEVTLRLRSDDPQLFIENRLWKPSTTVKEAAFFAFPFAVSDPQVRYEITGGLTGDGLDHIPGAPQHLRAVRDWVSLVDGDRAIAWATRDAPLVHPQTIPLPYAPFPDSTTPREPGTIYSWVHNNVWDTNFPVQQGFEATFAYAVGVPGDRAVSPTGLAVRTATELCQPVLGFQARGRGRPAPAEFCPLEIDDDRVRVLGVRQPGSAGGAVQVGLQSYADEPVTVSLTWHLGLRSARQTTLHGDLVTDLEVVGADPATVTVSIGRLGVTAVQLVPDRAGGPDELAGAEMSRTSTDPDRV